MQNVRALLQRMIQTFVTGDVLGVDSFVSKSYLDHQGLGGLEVRGPEGFRRVVELARSAFTNLDVTIEDLIVEGDRVAARLQWVGMRASDGVVVRRETIDIVKFVDNQAVEHWGVRLWVDPA